MNAVSRVLTVRGKENACFSYSNIIAIFPQRITIIVPTLRPTNSLLTKGELLKTTTVNLWEQYSLFSQNCQCQKSDFFKKAVLTKQNGFFMTTSIFLPINLHVYHAIIADKIIPRAGVFPVFCPFNQSRPYGIFMDIVNLHSHQFPGVENNIIKSIHPELEHPVLFPSRVRPQTFNPNGLAILFQLLPDCG
jgi:hypothetical protein